MTLKAKMLASAVALAASVALVAPASAAVIVKDFTGGAGTGDTFTPADPSGGLPVNTFLKKANTYDFVFVVSGVAPGDTTQIQIQAQAQNTGSLNISYNVFSGAPGATTLSTSAANFVASSQSTGMGTPTNAFANLSLGDGSYFLQVAGSQGQIAVNNELASGTLLENVVPEPMAWSLMLLGFGGVGAALRRRTAVAA